ncbi:MAG: phosphomannomutase [Pyrinomonadaceae bacterium]|nr:phosphomannomutase [Pyrinomonadaceae bacterium]MDX6271740.1 phosphomannomutase [Acidobacteriota bacterium]
MKTVLLLDIDNTLTPPRRPLNKEMADIVNRLNVPFHVAAGSHMKILQEQFFSPLYLFGFRQQFDAFLSNGAIHYHCDYSEKMSVEVVSAFNIREYLGESDYRSIINILEKTLGRPEFRLPSELDIMGEQVAFRGSMINLCPIGRTEEENTTYHHNRDLFVKFDQMHGYRQGVMTYLKGALADFMSERSLAITLGGQTSFDIGIAHQDKSTAVRTLLDSGIEKIIFIGDALFEGGNDAPIREFRDNWPFEQGPCPLETIQVNSYTETVERLYELNFVN